MAKLPILTARELNKILKRLRFKKLRQEGSHMVLSIQMDGQLLYPTIREKISIGECKLK